MQICIAGKNNIAIDVCSYIIENYPDIKLVAVVNETDNGTDGFQRSFSKYIRERKISIVELQELYTISDLIFLSLEYDRIIKPSRFATNKLFNIHFSLLPEYKGMYTSALPILHGALKTGVTLHAIDLGIDTGDVLYQKEINLAPNETAKALYLKYIALGTELVLDNIHSIIHELYIAKSQKDEGSTYYSKKAINFSNIEIDLNVTAWQLSCQIRAYNFRDYQLPKVYGFDIVAVEIRNSKSIKSAGSILEDNLEYICLSTIDYDILLYKDRLSELIQYCTEDNLLLLKRISKLEMYLFDSEATHGWGPLIVAVYNHSKEVCRYLIEKGADVNGCNFNGTTVIMYAKDAALRTNDYEIIDVLLEAGANPYVADYSGKNLFDYLQEQSVELLEYIKR